MKKILLSMMFSAAVCSVFAQDPTIATPFITPTPVQMGHPITVSLNFQNVSSVAIENPDPVNNPTGLRISLNKIKPNFDGLGNPIVTGAGAAFFNWTAICSGDCNGTTDATDIWTVIGLQNSVIPGAPDPFNFAGGPVVIGGTVTAPSTLAQANGYNGSGFIANISPGGGGDIDNSIGSNVQFQYTYTALPPVTTDDAETTTPNTPVDIVALTNDSPSLPFGTPGHSPIVPGSVLLIDPADGLKKQEVIIPGEGTFTVNPTTGLVVFVPALNYVGNSSVDYTIKDMNDFESNVSTITVTISPLPVTLISFIASREGKIANLAWSTTEETNSDRFEIERSQAGKDWAKIGTIESHGESTVKRNYTFADVSPLNGENLYRLKMIDNDATFAYSRIRSAKFEGANQTGSRISVYPNPSSDKVYLKDADVSQINGVSIVDVNGRAVYSSKSVSADGINVSNLSAGMYVLSVKNLDGTSKNHKLLISR